MEEGHEHTHNMNTSASIFTLTSTRMAILNTLTNTGMNTHMLTTTSMSIQRDTKVILMRTSTETTIMSTLVMKSIRVNIHISISNVCLGVRSWLHKTGWDKKYTAGRPPRILHRANRG